MYGIMLEAAWKTVFLVVVKEKVLRLTMMLSIWSCVDNSSLLRIRGIPGEFCKRVRCLCSPTSADLTAGAVLVDLTIAMKLTVVHDLHDRNCLQITRLLPALQLRARNMTLICKKRPRDER